MARRKKGTPIHGWLVLDKPGGLTSTRALSMVKRVFNAQKAGHAGTLDPLATGVLPIAFGEATKTVSYAMDGIKSYRFDVQWGVETTTDDCEGNTVQTADTRPSESEIRDILATFTGDICQVPPAFSAIKVNGARAYEVARQGQDVALEPRAVHIEALSLEAMPAPDRAVFEVTCGKGTYVRSLARDMGRKLGCLGHVAKLRRTRVGSFLESDAVAIDVLEAAAQTEGADGLSAMLRPIEAVLGTMVRCQVAPSDAAQLARGQPVLIRGHDLPNPSQPVYAICKGRVIALGEVVQGAIRPFRVFNYAQ